MNIPDYNIIEDDDDGEAVIRIEVQPERFMQLLDGLLKTPGYSAKNVSSREGIGQVSVYGHTLEQVKQAIADIPGE